MERKRLIISALAALAAVAFAQGSGVAVQAPPPPTGVLAGGKPLECRPPEYPMEARRYGLEGRTVVELLIGDDGRVQGQRVFESSGWKLLDETTMLAMSACRFSPVTRDGKPAGATWKKVAFKWELGHGDSPAGTRPVPLPEACPRWERIVMTERPAGRSGVLLRFLTSPVGGTFGIKVERGSGDAAIDAEAVRAIGECKFTPSFYKGLPGPGKAFAFYQYQ